MPDRYGFAVADGVDVTAGVGDGVPPGVGVLLRLMVRSSKVEKSTVVPPVFR